jgi:hypothetical protein
MKNPTSSEHALDPEMSALVERFEAIYAELSSQEGSEPEPSRHAPAPPDPLIMHGSYELPEDDATLKLVIESAHAREKQVPESPRPQPQAHPSLNATGADDDIESALAILRAGEAKSGRIEPRMTKAPLDEPEPRAVEHLPALRSSPIKRFAIPAAALAVFVGLAVGYLMTHMPRDSAAVATVSAPQIVVPPAKLRLDYELRKFKRGATVAQSKVDTQRTTRR